MQIRFTTKTLARERSASTATFVLSALLFLSSLSCRCTCAQIPARSFYESDGDGTAAASATNTNADTQLNPIPMKFYMEVDDVNDVSEFIDRFVDKDSIDPQLGIQENLRRNVERAAATVPKPANCIPENTIVPLIPLSPSKDPNVIYYPKCTRVKRCGGCCSSDLMSCQPTETETLNFELTKYVYGAKALLRGKELVVVEQHTKCKCACRVKEEDCQSNQVYRPDLCRCMCTNEDARQKCLNIIQEQGHKIWDGDTCRCVCRDQQSCTTGLIFDESQCKCIDRNT